MGKDTKQKRIDLGNGYMVIETDGWYNIVTPGTPGIPEEQFRRMIAYYASKVMRNPK